MHPRNHHSRHLLAVAVAASLSSPAATAGAQGVAPPPWAGLSLSFLQPTGTGTPSTPFEIWVRATLAPTAAPIVFDGASPGTGFGLGTSMLPDYGNSVAGGGRLPFAAYDDAALSSGYLCNGDTFLGACSGGPYAFAFNFDGSGQPAWQGQQTFTLLPGESYDYLFGTLIPPAGGGAAPGTYRFTGTLADVVVYGRDASGGRLQQRVTLAESCAAGDPNTPPGCGFTRTVGVAVAPEPAAVVLLATGVLALAVAGRVSSRRARRS